MGSSVLERAYRSSSHLATKRSSRACSSRSRSVSLFLMERRSSRQARASTSCREGVRMRHLLRVLNRLACGSVLVAGCYSDVAPPPDVRVEDPGAFVATYSDRQYGLF